LITDDVDHMRKNIDFLSKRGAGVSKQWQAENALSRMIGIHLEGPCLAPEKPGVHPPQFIKPPSIDLFKKLASDNVLLVTMAPEKDPGCESLNWLMGKGVRVALGHSNATFDEAEVAFGSGVNLVTHLFNALPALHHRAPGAVGAALLDKQVTCCLIADGLHLDANMVRLVLSIKGKQNSILVTDIAQIGTTGGGLVGSSITLDMAVRNVVNWGAANFADAIYMATYNPARAMGVQAEVGVISPGALADLVLWDIDSLEIKHVVLNGRVVK
jgi:N-acetylglucosamine-6-phosphate deacetylase